MSRIPVALLVVMLAMTIGCKPDLESATPPSSETRSVQRSQERDLPPPGNPVVGKKPPMPNPVQIPNPPYTVTTIATHLVTPWDMAFTPDGRIYVTERPGRVRIITGGNLRDQPYHTLQNVRETSEGGLMGIALHPGYPSPRWVYLMYTYSADGNTYNKVSRFTDTGQGLTDERAVVTQIPGAQVHDGGIIRFGPDGMLYVGTGDATEPELAQDLNSLAGKILRVTPEGGVPTDNPFPNSMVYAYGFRNVQGIAWNPANGDLWATNHGPTGEFRLYAKDSVFIVEKGGNHGWPRVLGVTDVRGVVDPVLFFPDSPVPPGLATFYNASLMSELRGSFFFASLRGEHLQRVILSGPRDITRIERWFQTGTENGRYGRLRSVVQGRDGAIYVSTSNRARGKPTSEDDRILRISPRPAR